MTEAELLDRFARIRDESAFALLVERHGPMVLSVCRHFLSDPNDVDDAFQATFLVLVRKAAGLRHKELLGNWLYGVACRVAQRARSQGTRWKSRFAPADQIEDRDSIRSGRGFDPGAAVIHRLEEGPLIHEEVGRLPQKYRTPIILCYFEGLSHDEAATRLGWPVGTVKGRLSRARDLLRPRLARRGVAVSSAALAAMLASAELRAEVPDALARSTLQTAIRMVERTGSEIATGSTISLPITRLTKGVLRTMFVSQAKVIVIPVLVAGILTGTATVTASLFGAQFGGAEAKHANRARSAAPAPQPGNAAAQPKGSPIPGSGGLSPEAQTKGEVPAGMPGPLGGAGGLMTDGGGFGGDGGEDLDSTRILIARVSARISTTDKNPRNAAILKKLDEPVSLHFPNETPLGDVLKRIKEASKPTDGKPIPVYVDPTGLQEAEKTMESPVVIDLEDVPLRFSLRLALKQLGLAYCVRDGVVIISSVNGIQQELMEAQAEQIGLHPEQYPMQGMMGQMSGMGGGMGGMGGGMRSMGGQGGMM
jgi:RNA polymerase sigma factor (sigma-70 family)